MNLKEKEINQINMVVTDKDKIIEEMNLKNIELNSRIEEIKREHESNIKNKNIIINNKEIHIERLITDTDKMKEQIKVLDSNYLQLRMINQEQIKNNEEIEKTNIEYRNKIINIENKNIEKDNSLCNCQNEIEQLKCCVTTKSKSSENC
jgi:hypothetical protein